jgi:CubicO group peptidase (beta-lactamase class C family)
VGRYVYYNFANITDHEIFPSRELKADSQTKFAFPVAAIAKAPKSLTVNGKQESFDGFLAEHKTVAFLVIRNDTIQYEKYFNGYDEGSVVASFSMAKSVTSLLIGCALDDKLIKSIDEPVTNYIPELKENGLEKVTVRHLLQMMSGVRFDESYANPFADAGTYYYGRDLRKAVFKRKLQNEPGARFSYSSGDTQMLGLVLERALKGQTITSYLQEKIWTPLQMEYDASWSLDRKENGLEKTFCCINARARDFAKIGRLYLNKGKWNGKQIVSESWVTQSTKADTVKGQPSHYKFQWWLPNDKGDFAAQGILGQYIYVNPANNVVIVRLGENYGGVNWLQLLGSLAEGYK